MSRPVIRLEADDMPFLKVLITYLLGVILAQCFSWTHDLVLWMMGVSFSLLLLLLISFFQAMPAKVITLFLYSSWITLGMLQYGRSLPENKIDFVADRDFMQLVGQVADEPLEKKSTMRMRVSLLAGIDSSGTIHAVSGQVLLTVYKDSALYQQPKYGDQLQFAANLQRIAPPYNPKEFDYKNYLANRGIHHQQRLSSTQLVILKSHTTWYNYVLYLKEYVVAQFRANIGDQTAFSIASALVFGYRAEMDAEIYSTFTSTGTIHILSVSGMHVGMVFILLTFLLRPLDRWKVGRSLRFILVLSFIWLYVVLTGMAPPILRAGIMISFLVMGQWYGRRQQSLNALFASGFFILWYDPKMLFEVGFQLSYLAMLGIFLIFPLLRSWYLPRNRWLRVGVEYSYISIAAQLVTTPLTLYYFAQFPNYFLLANLLITIPATVIMYIGVGLMLLPIPVVAQLLGTLEGFAIQIMVTTLQWIGDLPGAIWQGFSYTTSQVIILFGALTSFFIAANYRMKIALYALCAIILFLMITSLWQWNDKINYQGVYIYQMRQHVAIAWYEREKVILFSTLDSLEHPSIQYAVMPHLRSYRPTDQIHLVKIPGKENCLLTLGEATLYVWNIGAYNPPADVALILVRNNNRLTPDLTCNKALHILDGSSRNFYISKNSTELNDQSVDYYTLKDNFAYVWKTD
ncbi:MULTISPECIES: ComEC/Rec2 family competence protein [Sphingobacterium]|uniref:ComEC/Rec2 family competence protein n=1 Tax=Sphingobacterium populi TaxID=1812824 RepID=A0ABW5UF20_9SPHI|nr:ComEC/Rec2 family competence protein [Sphingobacterium sp. CFCC 11742]